MVTADVSCKIGDLFFRVTKRVKSRILFDEKFWSIPRNMIKTDDRIELQHLATGIEIDEGYAISKNIVNPPDIGGIRCHFNLTVEQTLVKAVPRPKHELM